MAGNFLKESRSLVLNKIKSTITDNSTIAKAMCYSALAESKMIRAGLVFAFGKNNKKLSNQSLLSLATSIELMHTYSLIHDDLPAMDNDYWRRGQKTNHIKYGEDFAILAGDALHSLSYEIIAFDNNLDAEKKINAIQSLSSSCGFQGMVLGQELDIHSETNKIDESFVEKMHYLKTGKLIETAVSFGFLGKKIDSQTQKNIFNFAKSIGHGFQIKDDFLDIFGSEDQIGKSLHSDKKNNKKNYIHLLGKRKTEEKLVKYHENALKNLHQIDSYENNPEIYALTDFIFKRKK